MFKGSDVPTKIGKTITGAWEQFWLDALPATTNDSLGDASGSWIQVHWVQVCRLDNLVMLLNTNIMLANSICDTDTFSSTVFNTVAML